ncbi:hypothetical protein [Pedobacter gandavensis]|nr:hypothetical protein [Pedobacter gandavensis]
MKPDFPGKRQGQQLYYRYTVGIVVLVNQGLPESCRRVAQV